MSESEFWALVEQSREAADEYEDGQAEALQHLLSGRSSRDLIDFERILRRLEGNINRHDIWDAGHMLTGDMDDRHFMDFSKWLISRGQAVYELVLADPENLGDVEDRFEPEPAELFGYAVGSVYEAKYDLLLPSEAPPVDFTQGMSVEDWDLPRRFPRLYTTLRRQGRLPERWNGGA
jgi:hypothetical protein